VCKFNKLTELNSYYIVGLKGDENKIEKINRKIQQIQIELLDARKRCEAFGAHSFEDVDSIVPIDIYDMGLAYDSEERLLMDLELAYSEKYPDLYKPEEVAFFRAEKLRLTKRIRAWQNRQMPSLIK